MATSVAEGNTKTRGEGWLNAVECAVCGGKGCRVNDAGTFALCHRIANEKPKGRFWLHRIADGATAPSFTPSKSKPSGSVSRKLSGLQSEYGTWLEWSSKSTRLLSEFAQWRAVPTATLQRLGGYPSPSGKEITFPERSIAGDVIGTNTRYREPIINPDGKKQRFNFSGSRGWQYPDEWWHSHHQALLTVEGFADCASALAAGFAAIGRYTRDAPLTELVSMLRRHWPIESPIIIIAENDLDDDGKLKPIDGLRLKAQALANELRRDVWLCRPPEADKDINDVTSRMTKGQGHLFSDRRWHTIGMEMLRHFRLYSEVIEPTQEAIEAFRQARIAANKQVAESHIERIKIAQSLRAAERAPDKVDMDWDVSNSCCFHKSFRKQKELKVVLWAGKLACCCWQCYPCRERMLKPKWKVTLIRGFCKTEQVFCVRCCGGDGAKIKQLQRAAQKRKALWAIVDSGLNEDEIDYDDTEPTFENFTGERMVYFQFATSQCAKISFRIVDEFSKRSDEYRQVLDCLRSRLCASSRQAIGWQDLIIRHGQAPTFRF